MLLRLFFLLAYPLISLEAFSLQEEALAISDRLKILNQESLVQLETLVELLKKN